MSAKHTPGPWSVGGDGDWVTGPDRSVSVICDMVPREYGKDLSEEDLANARLIAAAPEMEDAPEEARTALLNWQTWIKVGGDRNYDIACDANGVAINKVLAAIAKARGE